ncbi:MULTISPECIES: zf-HC2 domain-containing protein [unclassified Corynebacterium]|uniref:zf-HC2 domain-containing protein n=1 Tax=unclassified Corynebacterium TaxID=2624378 RepID=UPI0030971FAB
MDCERVRAALSARLDGETSGADDDVVDAHLDACQECQAWFEKAVSLNRSLLMGPASSSGLFSEVNSTPGAVDLNLDDLSERILSTVEPERRRRERAWLFMSGSARVVLVILGLLWVAWAIMSLVHASDIAQSVNAAYEDMFGFESASITSTLDPMAEGARLAVELAAIRLALAVGLFWASWRPQAAMGMMPVYGAIAMFSFGFGTRDMILGAFTVADASGMVLMILSAIALGMVWLGGFTPAAFAQAWRAASGDPVPGLPQSRWS